MRGTVIIKHANPCGVSVEKNQIQSFNNALSCDPISCIRWRCCNQLN